ncbi:MAG: Aminoalkylphosphonate N-acetyltransferase [Candidatus Celerinatantimonas neptuna]|nr:MAG: Aminoalkylphosphonate N-acetyltransferase [Candidatus Celerinatantimonas neptuna]
MYVDDLIVDQAQRSLGAGSLLIDWLKNYARQNNCQQLHLDSGVQRFDAHRFYLRERLRISCHHFSLDL